MSADQSGCSEERPEGRSIAYGSFATARPTRVGVCEVFSSLPRPSSSFRFPSQERNGRTVKETKKSFDVILNRLQPKPIPECFVLGRTTITVDTTCLPIVLRRICRFIKKCSMDFRVFPEEGRVDCRALAPLSFSIWIWQEEHGHDSIIIELQRRRGCCVMMQRFRKAFTVYLESGTDFDPNLLSRCSRAMPLRRFRNRIDLTTSSSVVKRHTETLDRCHSMLESESEEQKLLAMENLRLVLSNHSVESEATLKVAEAIVWGQNGDICTLDELTFFIIGNQRRKFTYFTTDACDFEENEFADGRTCGVMHNLALQVLTGALGVVAHHRKNADDHKSIPLGAMPWPTIISALCYNVGSAASRPQEAALSTQCLLLLDDLTLNHGIVRMILENSTQVLPCLFEAQSFGTTHNDRLDREVSNLLGRIGQSI